MNTTDGMVKLTPAARGHFERHIAASQGVGVRLEMKPDGCAGYGYVVTFPEVVAAKDVCFKVEGLSVMIDPESVHLLQGVTIDFVSQSLGQKQLVFQNPQVASMCGCGESVQLIEDAASSESG